MARNASLESDFRGFFQISSDLMLISDSNAIVTDLNTAWLTTLGWARDDLIGTSFLELIHPDDLASTIVEYHVLLDGDKETIVEHETRVRCKDGTYRWTDWTAGMIGESMYAIGRDITTRKSVLAGLAESLETTRAIFDAAIDSIVVIDRDLNIVETSSASAEIHGHPTAERRSSSVLDHIHPDDRADVERVLRQAFQDGDVAVLSFRIRHADGHYVALEARGRALRNVDGPPNRLVFIGRDATESNAARAALTESLETTRAIFDAAADGIVMMDRNFDIVESNSAVARMLGVTPEERANQSTMAVIHPDDLPAVREAAERLFVDDEIVTMRYRVHHADGHWVQLEARGRGLVNPHGPTTLAVFVARDITKAVQDEEALAASLETTRAIFDAAADGIVLINREFQVVESNLASGSLFGATAGERSGQASLDVIVPEDLESVFEAGERMFNTGEVVTARYRVIRPDGVTAVIESRGRSLVNHFGPPNQAVFIARDMTESVEAERALAASVETTRAILEAAPDSIIMIDAELNVLDASPSTLRTYGMTPEDRVGASALNVVFPDDREWVENELKRNFRENNREPFSIRFRALHQDGHALTIEARGLLLSDESGLGPRAVIVSRDISDAVIAEASLAESVTLMKEAKEAAEQSNLAKSEFMSRMSHELRTPLNSVLGFSQILQMELGSPDQRQLVDHIFKSGTHLLDLINEVLDISRVESGHISVSLESVSVDDVVDECVRIMTPQASEAGITMVVRDCHDTQVLSDQQRLTQVLLNLMSNAVKYNSDRGTVTIECRPHGDRVRLTVTDTGPGLAPVMVDRLFVPFERLDADSKGIEGTGLGLAHSKSLIEAIGGSIGVESTLGKGSTFWIDVPATDVPRSVAPEPRVRVASTHTSLPDTTVLYIEDNIANIHLIERLLANRPTVHLVTSIQGGLGIELAQQLNPALILLDVHLPDLHGFDVLHRLRDDERTKDIPVVVISADATDWQTGRFLDAGANDYLTKPFDLRRLLEMLDEYLGVAPLPLTRHDEKLPDHVKPV